MRVECTCARAKHQHGTVTAYLADKCRCDDCRHAAMVAQKRYRMHLAHIGPLTLDVTGTRRRLLALACNGWSLAAVSAMAGIEVTNLRLTLRERPRIHRATAASIAEVYERLADVSAPTSNLAERCSVARARLWAAQHDAHPAIAWDDDTIDDPNAKPYACAPVDIDEIAVEQACNGRRVHLTRAERLAAVATLTERGYSEKQISELLGRPTRTVARDKAALRGQDAA